MLPLFLACAPCPSFAEMTLPPDRPDLAAVIAEFAALTGREGVCVPGVEWRDELSGDDAVLGRYDGPNEPILLRADVGGAAEVTLRHELCHALDGEEGLADALADVLDADSVSPVDYPTPELRRAEAFARACEGGPPRLALREALEAGCGLATEPAAAPVLAQVYAEAPAELPVTVGAPPETHPLGEHVGTVLLDAAARGGTLWLLLDDGVRRTVATHRAGAPTTRLGVPADTRGLGPGDGSPLLVGDLGVVVEGAVAFEGPAVAAASTGSQVWVATPDTLWGAPSGPSPFSALDVDASGRSVVATTFGARVWRDGALEAGIDGEAGVAVSESGNLLLAWYLAGVAGVAEREGEGWRVHTRCDASLSGAAPVWWDDRPYLAVTGPPALVGWRGGV